MKNTTYNKEKLNEVYDKYYVNLNKKSYKNSLMNIELDLESFENQISDELKKIVFTYRKDRKDRKDNKKDYVSITIEPPTVNPEKKSVLYWFLTHSLIIIIVLAEIVFFFFLIYYLAKLCFK